MSSRDTWATGGAYEPYVGRWSRLVAKQFLEWLARPAGGEWLDVGCGTGALSEQILSQAQPLRVTGVDPAEGFLAYAARRIADGRASFCIGDAMALPFRDETFDVVVSGLALNFIPRHDVAVAELVRAAKHHGAAAAYVWDYAGEMQMMRLFWDAATALDPAAAGEDEGRRFPICQPEPLANLFATAGLTSVEVRAIDATTRFRNFDDFWLPFLGGQGPAPGYLSRLTEEARTALHERIRSMLPIAPDGSISLTARAWAVRGTK